MDAIYKLLEKFRLEAFYRRFLEFGIQDERDFLDSVTDDDLTTFGLSQAEKNRFAKMKDRISRFRAPVSPTGGLVEKSLKAFSLLYTYPKCPAPKGIEGMDPAQNTVEDLMLRICHLEGVESSKGVCLYTVDGMPLTEDPFFNTWSLQDRHIKSGDVIYAIFTLNRNLKSTPRSLVEEETQTDCSDTVRCHIMLKGDFEVTVSLASDTIATLKKRLASESGIPSQVLHYKADTGSGNTLQSCGITEGSTVHFTLSSFPEESQPPPAFFIHDVEPSVQQTPKGISFLLSSLFIVKCKLSVYSLKKLVAYIRKLTGCNPLAQSLFQLLCKNQAISRNQKIAIVEGLYLLFRELLPDIGSCQGDKVVEDLDVFEYSTRCWAYLMSQSKEQTLEYENFCPYSLMNEEGQRFSEPVTVPGIPGALERAIVVQKIKDGERIPNCSEEVLKEMSLKKATDLEKILLSVQPSVTTYYHWISHESMTGQNFVMPPGNTLGSMTEALKAFPQLAVTPPLHLKELGFEGPALVYLSKENLGVYMKKNKDKPEMIELLDCLSGKVKMQDVNILAASTGDLRKDHSFATTRTPKEAILVLVDASSSMNEKCYGSVDIKKMDAVKELFDNFASRTMAYDFHHVIGLIKFDTSVKMIHTFTETLETFKKYVRTLEPSGTTKLYDALHLGKLELDKVKIRFPECKLRILCLTDGNDVGSSNKPVNVAINLIKSNIIVDSVLLGNVVNNFLHGISIATGGCCFKPETSRDGIKLFEIETVLSLESRKPRNKADPKTITESVLTGYFATFGYDTFPEPILPSEFNGKVTLTQNALKKVQVAKDGRFIDREKRILEELKSLHCEPHPYFGIFPSESDFTFWKILMEGPPDTPYENGVFELFCQFGPNYPVKPPTVRFVTSIYHCNINNVGRICHNIFDRNYNAQITMRDILNAVFGLLICPEPEDPLDSVLAEEYMTNHEVYQVEAKKHTEKTAGESLDDKEKKLAVEEKLGIPPHLICRLTNKIFVAPVKTKDGTVYERKAIEKHLRKSKYDPFAKPQKLLRRTDLRPDRLMEQMVRDYRSKQIQETSV